MAFLRPSPTNRRRRKHALHKLCILLLRKSSIGFAGFAVFSLIFYRLLAGITKAVSPRALVLAVVYPQYHAIPENDAAYGVGFVEWTLLNKTPDHFGALQTMRPHPDIGYYNMLSYAHRRKMRILADHFGVDGFIWYHYFLNERFILNRPTELMLLDGEPDTKFCFCYANEAWSRNWDGSNRDVTLEHTYGSSTTMLHHYQYMRQFFQHKNYILHNGKPLFIFYRTEQEDGKELHKLMRIWRRAAVMDGFRGISFFRFKGPFMNGMSPRDFDGEILFQPGYVQKQNWNSLVHGYGEPIFEQFDKNVFDLWNPEFSQTVSQETYAQFDEKTKDLVSSSTYAFSFRDVYRAISLLNLKRKQHPGLVFAWSNHPRRLPDGEISPGHRTVAYFDFSYDGFLRMAESVIQKCLRRRGTSFVTLTAWNEWNEQSMFEPSKEAGYSALLALQEATRRAYFSVGIQTVKGTVVHVGHLGGGTERYYHDLQDLFPQFNHAVVSKFEAVSEVRINRASKTPFCLHIHSTMVLDGMRWRVLNVARNVHEQGGRILLTVHDFQWLFPTDPNRLSRATQASKEDIENTRELLLHADLSIFPSNFVRNSYAKLLGSLDAYRTVVAHHPDFGVDREVLWVPVVDRNFTVAFLGEFSKRKGSETFEEIMEALPHSRHRINAIIFGIVGDDALNVQRRLSTKYNVIFRGKYEESSIVETLRQSGVHVLTLLSTVEETYCYALTHAINSGIPILHSGQDGAIQERLSGVDRAFSIHEAGSVRRAFSKAADFVFRNQGEMRPRILSSYIIQPNWWYIENYPFHAA